MLKLKTFKYAVLLVALALQAAHAADDALVPTLTPKEVLQWMAPLRVEDGRLDIDWTSVGILASSTAGLKQINGRLGSEINADVRFNISLPSALPANSDADGSSANAAAAAPDLQFILHVEGGSTNARPFPGAPVNEKEIPIIARLNQKDAPTGLRGYLRARGLPIRDGAAFDVTEMKLNLDSSTCLAIYELSRPTREFSLRFKEERALKYELSISQAKNVLLIRFENVDSNGGFTFTQKPGGEVELTYDKGATKVFVRAENLRRLMQKNTADVQLNFLRPLADAGVLVAMSQDLPVVMAAATSGFSAPLPAIAQKADGMIATIRNAETPAERARATTELSRFYPQAIYHILNIAEKEADNDLKSALKRVISGHPGIIRAFPYVQAHKLHDDRTYLFDVFENSPLFKDAARARLAVLLGKDYGENPVDWKK